MLKKVASEIALYSIANIANRLSIFLLAAALSFVLPTDEYGQWSIWTSALLLLVPLFDFGTSKAFSRLFFDRDVAKASSTDRYFKDVQSLRLLLTIGLLACVGVIGYALWPLINGGKLPVTPFFWLALACAAFEAQILLVITFFRLRHDPVRFLITRSGQTAVSIIAALSLSQTYGLKGAVIGYLSGAAVASVGATMWVWRQSSSGVASQRKLRSQEWRRLLAYGSPLALHDLGWWARNSSDPILMAIYLPLSVIGSYYLGYTAGGSLGLIVWSVDLALAPYYYRFRTDNPNPDLMIKVAGRLALGLLALVASFGIVLLPPTFALIWGERMAVGAGIAPIIMFGMAFQIPYVIWIKSAYYAKLTGWIPAITLCISVLAVGLNLVLIPILGYLAPAMVTVLAFAAIAASSYFLGRWADPTGIEALPYVPALVTLGLALCSTKATAAQAVIIYPLLLTAAVWLFLKLIVPSFRILKREIAASA